MVRLDCAKTPDSAPESLSSTVKGSPTRRVPTLLASTSFVVQSSPQLFSKFHHSNLGQIRGQINVQRKHQGILLLHRQAAAESVHEVSSLDFPDFLN